MVLERARFLAGCWVPELDEPVVAARGEGFAVGAPGEVVNGVLVSLDNQGRFFLGQSGVWQVKEADLAGGAGDTGGHGQSPAVGAERQSGDAAFVCGRLPEHIAGADLQEIYVLV